jgi:hypothetical protein
MGGKWHTGCVRMIRDIEALIGLCLKICSITGSPLKRFGGEVSGKRAPGSPQYLNTLYGLYLQVPAQMMNVTSSGYLTSSLLYS